MFKKSILLLSVLFGSLFAAPIDGIDALSVSGTQVVGANGQPAKLRGMSMFWNIAQEAGPYWNANVVNWLAEDWHANLVRAAMGVEDNWGSDPNLTSEGYKGYEFDAAWNQAMVETIVDAAIAKGIYVIIDWHSHWTDDPSKPERQAKAVEFFTNMATKYGQYPNVIYEIYNEPGCGADDDCWNKIKSYAEKVIPAIRAIDPDNLILVGTPSYSSQVQIAANNPLTGDNAFNVAYVFHFYASEEWHYNNYMGFANTAMQKIPLFVSEWGLSPASGNGTINYSWLDVFFNWMEEKNLSWAAWSICNKNESSASLQTSASPNGNWAESDLRESGTWLRNKLRTLNPEWSAVSGGGSAISSKQKSSSSLLLQGTDLLLNLNESANMDLIAISGEVVKSYKNLNANTSVSLQGLPKGIYLVKLQSKNSSKSYKINLQ